MIPPEQNGSFVANMEMVLDVYKHPFDLRFPVVCMDESPKQLIGDAEAKTLTVQLHHFTNPISDKAVRTLCETLNESETIYPGAEMRMIYKLGSDLNPRNQVL